MACNIGMWTAFNMACDIGTWRAIYMARTIHTQACGEASLRPVIEAREVVSIWLVLQACV
jgi:hypothetical protein